MSLLLSLWLPIVASAAAVYVVSSLIHMVFKWHAADHQGLPDEESVRKALRSGGTKPGVYCVPFCKEMKEMCTESMLAKYREGPVAILMVGENGPPQMGKYLGLWFAWNLVVAAVAVAIAGHVHGLGHDKACLAATLAAAVTFAGYGFGSVQESIWMLRPWASTARYLLDATLYAAATGGMVLWLWP